MKKSKLTKIIEKTKEIPDYFFGLLDNNYYKDASYFFRTFQEGSLTKYNLKNLKFRKFIDFTFKNFVNLADTLIIYSSFKSEDISLLIFIPAYEGFRYFLHNVKKRDKRFIAENEKKIKSELTYQSLKEIKDEYDLREEQKLFWD